MSIGTPYKRAVLQDRYDSIVIGSGIGGLAVASMLARHRGERVLVLEQHYTAGGFTHSFRRPGFDWDVGVHYIGEVHRERSSLRRTFDHLTDGELQWASMGDVYDRVELGGRRFDFVAGAARLRDALVAEFPAEAAGIDGYLDQVRAVNRTTMPYFAEKVLPSMLAPIAGPPLRLAAMRHIKKTTADVVHSLVRDPDLRGILTAQWGDYGLPPSKSSFFIHAMVAGHYFNGSAYPVGGASRIAETILPSIENAGGAVVVRAPVERIVLEKGRAVGVEVEGGRRFTAKRIVSDAGAAITFGRLLPEDVRPIRLDGKGVDGIEASVAHLSLYVGLEGTPTELNMPKHNIWVYPSADHDGNFERALASDDAPMAAGFLSFAAARDPDFQNRHPGHATAEVVTFAPTKWFAPYRDSKWGKRGDDYDRLKQSLSDRLMGMLFEQLPQLEGKVLHAELSTPLSTAHFAGHPSGEIYGLAHDPRRFAAQWLRPETPIPGLYLAGADVCSAGVAGGLIGGLLCASAMTRSNMISVAERGFVRSGGERALAPT